ncbi:MAG: hypothetical protein J3K34DRAFT_457928 [Monoraphidium minutum]|nr:MAG: hypothetical protein J3K34DRAFT_457928 [Monoraphidium minutum]
MAAGWAHALVACVLVCGAQALLPEMPEVYTGRPPSGTYEPAAPKHEDDGTWGSAGGPQTVRASDRFLGRLEKEPGYGSYLCYNKGLFDDVPADVASLTRATIEAPEAVPATGAAPTVDEIIAFAANKFGITADELQLESLSAQVAANDWTDDKGVRHVRLVQVSALWDMEVELGAIVVHLIDNKAILLAGGVMPDVDARTSANVTTASSLITPESASVTAIKAALSTIPNAPKSLATRLTAKARAAAKGGAAAAKSTSAADSTSVQPTKRVLHCSGKDGKCKPTYKQVVFLPSTTASNPKEMHVYVSATDGAVLYMANRLRTARPQKAQKRKGDDGEDELLWLSLGRGKSLYAGEIPLNTAASTKKKGGRYTLNDLASNAATFDMMNKDDDYFLDNPKDTLYRDKDNQWGDSSMKNRQSAAVDAHWGATATLSYYKDIHNRTGADNKGSHLQSRVHTAEGFDNAYWYDMKMTYGDGSRNPKTWNTSCEGFPPLTPLDIIAHEITHGVTEYSAGLIYAQSMGGLNEALSDIMSQCVIDYAHENQGYPRRPDFKLGAQLYPDSCTKGRRFLRSMSDPTADNGYSSACWHPKFDITASEEHNDVDMYCYVDVHWSSGVANRAFYLMAEGLDNTCDKAAAPAAIGIKSACNVFYRALTGYMSKVADYHEARRATKQAATDLFGAGSPQVTAVEAAWDIVGAPRAAYPKPDAPKCQALFAIAPANCTSKAA